MRDVVPAEAERPCWIIAGVGRGAAEVKQPRWIIAGWVGGDQLVERGTLGWGIPAERLAKLL